MLDIGCGDGENLLRLRRISLKQVGLEVSESRLRTARDSGLNVVQASGTSLPFSSASFNLVYIAHVLHHVANYQEVISEAKRCLTPGGFLLLVETVTDNPLLRLSRKVHPYWQGDVAVVNWRYEELVETILRSGLEIEQAGRYNLIFFLWEMVPIKFWPLEVFSPIFVYLDLFLARFLEDSSAHCYFVLKLPSG